MDAADEPSSDRIAHDIPRKILQIFLSAQGVIMKSDLPDGTTSSPVTPDRERSSALDGSDDSAEIVVGMQLQKPVKVVWHDDIGKRRRGRCNRFAMQSPDDNAARIEDRKLRSSISSDGGDQVDLAADGGAASQEV